VFLPWAVQGGGVDCAAVNCFPGVVRRLGELWGDVSPKGDR